MTTKVENTIQNCRTKKQATQEELAKEIGVTRQTIIAIEKGNYTPSVLLALKFAKYFDTTVEKLFKLSE